VAAAVRDRVAASVDPVWGTLAELMAGWRVRARAMADAGARRALLQRAGSAEMVDAVRRGEGEALFAAWLAAAEGGGGQEGGRAGSDVQ
jgi:hypothetical protein